MGARLGLYRALVEAGPATAGELAGRTGTDERYAREWLEQQAVAGIVHVDDVEADPGARRYHLPPPHADVLTDEDSIHHYGWIGIEMVRSVRSLPDLVEAFKTGGAPPQVPSEGGEGEFNRAIFVNHLSDWLAQIPSVHDRLRADPPARVGDFACGTGWASISVARAYPSVVVDGFDLDEDRIRQATAHASEAGVDDRVRFHVRDIAASGLAGRYDVVLVMEALHDLARPVDALRGIHGVLAEGGSVIVGDERVQEDFIAPGDELERYVYGWSLVSCLPGAMGDPQSAQTGAAIRPATVRRYALEAGFREVEILPIEFELLRFYRLVP